MSFGDKLKELRIINNYSLDEASRLLHIGRTTLWEYENDITRPSLDKYFKILDFYNTSHYYFTDHNREYIDISDLPQNIKNQIKNIIDEYIKKR